MLEMVFSTLVSITVFFTLVVIIRVRYSYRLGDWGCTHCNSDWKRRASSQDFQRCSNTVINYLRSELKEIASSDGDKMLVLYAASAVSDLSDPIEELEEWKRCI